MREIKFRAWHKKENYLAAISVWDFIVGVVFFTGEEKEENEGVGLPIKTAVIEDCDIMQFTGLRDKRGKEIYEGDIIRAHYNGPLLFIVASELDWDGDSFRFVAVNHEVGPIHAEVDEKGEVIGNIYENPELLNK